MQVMARAVVLVALVVLRVTYLILELIGGAVLDLWRDSPLLLAALVAALYILFG